MVNNNAWHIFPTFGLGLWWGSEVENSLSSEIKGELGKQYKIYKIIMQCTRKHTKPLPLIHSPSYPSSAIVFVKKEWKDLIRPATWLWWPDSRNWGLSSVPRFYCRAALQLQLFAKLDWVVRLGIMQRNTAASIAQTALSTQQYNRNFAK